jgi:hypothetical protein
VLYSQVFKKKKKYILLTNLNSDDVVMSRENRNFHLYLFVKGRALHFHTTAICEVHENYVARDFENVYLADGSTLDIVGLGNVRIRVHSNSIWKL